MSLAEPRRSLRVAVAVACAVLAVLTATGRVRAEILVSLQYESKAELEHARRVASELASEGYTVEIGTIPELSPCDPNGPRLITISRDTKAWIRLAADPADADKVVAFICYLGAQPLLQQAAPSAPRGEGDQLALAAAEALNGLRVRLPPIQNEPERAPHPVAKTPLEDEPRSPPVSQPDPVSNSLVSNSLVLGTSLVRNFPDFPATPGIAGRGTLGVVPGLGVVIAVFVPTMSGELASEAMTAKIRTSWVRAGPRLNWTLGEFEISGALLAGPALTWATAVAAPPRAGAADIATGAIVTLGAFLQYPTSNPIFGSASLSASALLPGARVNLGEGSTVPRGYWPVDASIGLGVRWGE
jgi:hypothetical protein